MYGKSYIHFHDHHFFFQITFSDKLSSLDALIAALANLDKLCETVEDTYLTSLRDDKFERWEEHSWKTKRLGLY